MGAEQQNEPSNNQSKSDQANEKREPWWFNQPNPIDRFTGWLVAVTVLLTIATVINAVVLWVTDHTLKETLVETRKSAEAATKAAQAAEASNNTAADAAKRQLRAYLSISGINAECESCIKRNGTFNLPRRGTAEARMILAIKNSGATPAYQVKICSGGELGERDSILPDEFNYTCGKICETCPPENIGPGAEKTFVLHIPTEALVVASSGTKRLFYFGTVSFTDTFRGSRKLPFCWMYQGPGGEAIGCPKNNSPDDD